MALTAVLARQSRAAGRYVSSALAGQGTRLRAVISRHDGTGGERWALGVSASVELEWSPRTSGNDWRPGTSGPVGNGSDVGVAGDPRGHAEGAAYHAEIVETISADARRVRAVLVQTDTRVAGIGLEIL